MIQQYEEVAIKLTLAEWTQVINLVAEAPYRLVAPLIQKLGGQLQTQQEHNGLDRGGAGTTIVPPETEVNRGDA